MKIPLTPTIPTSPLFINKTSSDALFASLSATPAEGRLNLSCDGLRQASSESVFLVGVNINQALAPQPAINTMASMR